MSAENRYFGTDIIARADAANNAVKKNKDGPIIASWNKGKSLTTSGNKPVTDVNVNRSSLSTNDSRRG